VIVSLRARLALAVAGLIAIVTVAVGLVAGLSMQGALVADLDKDLAGAKSRAVRALTGAGPLLPGDAVGIPGQGPGTLAGLIDATSIRAAILDERGATSTLDTDATDALWRVLQDRNVGEVLSTTIDGIGSYRLTTEAVGPVLLVIGLPLDEVDATLARLWLSAAAIGGGVVIIGAGVGWFFGRSSERMLERVRASLRAREEGEERLRRFVADASHELRTPLASIRGYSELIRRSGARLRKDVAHSVDRIESESVRMTGLVEDLLLLARLDDDEARRHGDGAAEAGAVAREPIDIVALVATAVGDAQAAAPDHEWLVDAPSEPIEIEGDAARLHQAVMNLLSNAARHTPPGTHVTARVAAAGDSAVIEVIDDGPGVDPELAPNVFGRFVRGDSSRSRAAGSTGLGLAIVEAIARAHGGTAEYEYVDDLTKFRICIPIAKSQP